LSSRTCGERRNAAAADGIIGSITSAARNQLPVRLLCAVALDRLLPLFCEFTVPFFAL
jgi:hypothetical protein